MLRITENAKNKLKTLLNENNKLRVKVLGGGCSGFQYEFCLDSLINSDDQIIQDQVVIDSLSLEFLKGATLDYIVELTSEQFILQNPNASNKCGCGNSFSI